MAYLGLSYVEKDLRFNRCRVGKQQVGFSLGIKPVLFVGEPVCPGGSGRKHFSVPFVAGTRLGRGTASGSFVAARAAHCPLPSSLL